MKSENIDRMRKLIQNCEILEVIDGLEKENVSLNKENALLKAQNRALCDRTDFHEDVLTEIILTISP